MFNIVMWVFLVIGAIFIGGTITPETVKNMTQDETILEIASSSEEFAGKLKKEYERQEKEHEKRDK